VYVLDVLYNRDGGKRPEMIVTSTASYSDIVFGLLTLAGFPYAPEAGPAGDYDQAAAVILSAKRAAA
jgi:TnpA family transposase